MAKITYVKCDNCGKRGEQGEHGRYPAGWASVDVAWDRAPTRDVCDDCLARIGDIFKEPLAKESR